MASEFLEMFGGAISVELLACDWSTHGGHCILTTCFKHQNQFTYNPAHMEVLVHICMISVSY